MKEFNFVVYRKEINKLSFIKINKQFSFRRASVYDNTTGNSFECNFEKMKYKSEDNKIVYRFEVRNRYYYLLLNIKENIKFSIQQAFLREKIVAMLSNILKISKTI